MITQKHLAEMLKTVSATEIARLSGVSRKTVYRLRNLENSPSLKTIEALVSAVQSMKWVELQDKGRDSSKPGEAKQSS